MRTPLSPWLFGLALLAAPAAARAEEPTQAYPDCTREPTEAEVAAAKGAYQAGSASYNEADYARAIDYWEDAYRRDCTAHALLLNLARAYEVSDHKRKAVVALETYLKRQPTSPQKDQINRRIEVLKKQLASEAPQPVAAPPTPEPAVNQPPASAPPQPPPAEPLPSTASKRPILPLIVAGSGGVIFIGGGVTLLSAWIAVENFEDHCADPEEREGCPENEIDDANAARNRQTLGGVVMGVGAAVALGGVAWYLLSPRRAPSTMASLASRKAELSPVVGPGFAGLALDGRF